MELLYVGHFWILRIEQGIWHIIGMKFEIKNEEMCEC